MRVLLGSAFAGLVVVLAGCTGDRVEAGPFGEPGGDTYLCTPLPGQSPVVFGNEVLTNSGTQPATVNSVRLIGADGLVLDEAFLVPIQNRTLLGTGALPPSVEVWAKRQPAAGARIPAGETVNLALVLSRSEDRANFEDIEVTYESGDDSYRHRLAHELLVLGEGLCD